MREQELQQRKPYLAARFLLRELRRAGVRVRVQDGQLKVGPKGRLTREIISQITEHRDDLVAVLAA